jgi:hypothetical protein
MGERAMMIDCDENMIVHLLRNWRPNRLRPQGFRLSKLRPGLMELQKKVCPICKAEDRENLLTDDGKATHIDHFVTVKEFAG